MNDLEQKLKSARLAAPPVDLDRRMEQLFSAAQTRRRPGSAAFWLSFAAVGVAAAVTVLLIQTPRRPLPVPETVVYRFEAQGNLRQMLLNPSAPRDALPLFDAHLAHP